MKIVYSSGYTCRGRCQVDPECYWRNAEDKCYHKSTDTPGKPLSTCIQTGWRIFQHVDCTTPTNIQVDLEMEPGRCYPAHLQFNYQVNVTQIGDYAMTHATFNCDRGKMQISLFQDDQCEQEIDSSYSDSCLEFSNQEHYLYYCEPSTLA